MHIYIPPFVLGVICGVVGTISLEIAVCVIYFRKEEKKKRRKESEEAA